MFGQRGEPGESPHAILMVLVLATLVAGCSTPLSTREKGALAGGAIGAGAGAAIGSTSGHTGTGALIGAGVGAVSGALIGDAMQANEQRQAAPPPPPPVSQAPAPGPVVVGPPPTDGVSVEVNIGSPPSLVVVPGTPVYYAPNVSYNYFAYNGQFYVYQNEVWLSARFHNGPWTVIALERVPRLILGVPVRYYNAPPGHWKKKHGPPPWAPAKGQAKKKGDDD